MTDKELLALKEQRGKLIRDNRAVIEKREKAKEEITAEDRQELDKRFDELEALKDQINIEERQRDAEAEVATSTRQTTASEPTAERVEAKPETAKSGPKEYRFTQANGRKRVLNFDGPTTSDDYRTGFNKWLVGNRMAMTSDEHRALSQTIMTEGGALTPDMEFMGELIKFVDDIVWVRQVARMFSLPSADSLGFPSLDTDPSDGTWTSELLTGSADTAMAFGRRELSPHPNAERILVSKTLIRKAPGAETLVMERLAYKMAVTQEKAYLLGTGANQPLGVFTADANGISTSRDISTDNTTGAITADNLIRQKYNLKPQYRSKPTTAWMFHRDAVRGIALLKDGNGQYIWKPGIVADDPDRLLNLPIMESEYAPNTFTTQLYVGILGDWSTYWIVDALDVQIQALRELKAETNQDEFIIRHEGDGMPVLEEAWSRVKLA